jgi:hypothetical protein
MQVHPTHQPPRGRERRLGIHAQVEGPDQVLEVDLGLTPAPHGSGDGGQPTVPMCQDRHQGVGGALPPGQAVRRIGVERESLPPVVTDDPG